MKRRVALAIILVLVIVVSSSCNGRTNVSSTPLSPSNQASNSMLEKLKLIQRDWTPEQVYALLGTPDRCGERSVAAEEFYTVDSTTEAVIAFWDEGVQIRLRHLDTGETTTLLGRGYTAPARIAIPADAIPEKYQTADKRTMTPVSGASSDSPNELYADADGVQYYFDKTTGAYRGFIVLPPDEAASAGTNMTMPELETAANTAAAMFIRIVEYERTYFCQEDTGMHKFRYTRKIQGFSTEDAGNVWIDRNGYIFLVSFSNTDIFQNRSIPSLNEKALDDDFQQALGKDVLCRIQERTLMVKEGRLVMCYEYVLLDQNGNETGELEEKFIPIG